jgi:hypothetical protein
VEEDDNAELEERDDEAPPIKKRKTDKVSAETGEEAVIVSKFDF